MDLSIRRATPGDAVGVAAVHVGSWRETYAEVLSADVLAGLSVENRIRFWTWKLAEPATWVASDGPDVVGFLNVGPSRDPDLPDADEVLALYALCSHHDRGVGRGLMRACLDFVDGDVVTLWVLEANTRARRFYEKAGFAPDGTSKPADLFGVMLPKLRYRKDRHG